MINHDALRSIIGKHYESIRERNAGFSLRALAKRLSVSPAALSEVMRGKRRISEKMATQVAERLQLSPEEREAIFGHAVGLLPHHSPETYEQLNQDRHAAIAEWYHFAILSLAEMPDFRSDAGWIAQRLNISETDAAQAIDRLVALKLMAKTHDGHYVLSSGPLCTSDEIGSVALRAAHRQNLALAATSLERDGLSERDFCSITMAVDPLRLVEAKKLIREFRDRLCTYLEGGDKKEVYKMCVQLFPLSKSIMLVILALAGLGWTTTGLAGHAENNGGGVMVCPDARGGERVEMLDLWEARVVKKLTINYTDTPYSDAALRRVVRGALERYALPEEFRLALAAEVEFIAAQVIDNGGMLPTALAINPPVDGGNGFVGRDCSLRGVALLDTRAGLLHLDPTLYDRMSLTDRAALVMHEAVYKLFREWYGATDSIGTRHFVGCLFATDGCVDLADPGSIAVAQPGTEVWSCMTQPTNGKARFRFFAASPVDASLLLRLTALYDRPLVPQSVLRTKEDRFAVSLSDQTVQFGGRTYRPLVASRNFPETFTVALSASGESFDVRLGTAAAAPWTLLVDGEPILCQAN